MDTSALRDFFSTAFKRFRVKKLLASPIANQKVFVDRCSPKAPSISNVTDRKSPTTNPPGYFMKSLEEARHLSNVSFFLGAVGTYETECLSAQSTPENLYDFYLSIVQTCVFGKTDLRIELSEKLYEDY